MSQPAFSGVLTAIATPFKKDLAIDDESFVKLLRLQKKAGIHGVVVAGTTGESPTLSDVEREHLVRIALSERTENFRIYVGTGTNDTRSSVEASAKYAGFKIDSGAKVDGVMAVVPYYNKPPQSGLYAHFRAISEAIGQAPLCVYNVPGRTGAALSPATFLKLAKDCTNIAAIKEAAGDVRIITELARGLKETVPNRNVEVLSGDDPTFAPALLCGATGVISVTTHVIPEAMLAIWRAAKENDLKRVQLLHQQTYPINTQFFCAPNPVPLKWALAQLGICENIMRAPLSPLEPQEVEIVRYALEQSEKAGIKLISGKHLV